MSMRNVFMAHIIYKSADLERKVYREGRTERR